jgi:hypothetical protein
VVNTAKIGEEMLKKYREEESYPVIADTENLKKMKCKVVEAHIVSTKNYVRHDAGRLAKIIIDLATNLKRSRPAGY